MCEKYSPNTLARTHRTQPTINTMSYSRGTSVYKISCELGVPAGVVIRRGGSNINLMNPSWAQIRIRDNVVEIEGHRGSSRPVFSGPGQLSRGIIGLNMSQPTRKPRRKIRVKTNAATGWSSVKPIGKLSQATVEPKDLVCQ